MGQKNLHVASPTDDKEISHGSSGDCRGLFDSSNICHTHQYAALGCCPFQATMQRHILHLHMNLLDDRCETYPLLSIDQLEVPRFWGSPQ